MNISPSEVRAGLSDADLIALGAAEDGGYAAWQRMAEGLAEEWHGDLAERIGYASSEIAGIARRLWPQALAEALVHERDHATGYGRFRTILSGHWRGRLGAMMRPAPSSELQSRHIMDGTLPAEVLTAAIVEALGGVPVRGSRALRDIGAGTDPALRNHALRLGAAWAATSAREVQDHPLRLSDALRRTRASHAERGQASGLPDLRAVMRAGSFFAGAHASLPRLEAEQSEEGILVLIDGRIPVSIAHDVFLKIAFLIPSAAARRLRELARDEALALMADAVVAHSSNRSLASILGVQAEPRLGTFRNQRRLYEAAPFGGWPQALEVHGTRGRTLHALAVADEEGAHAGYAAFDPLSRELRGRGLRAAYDPEGMLRGSIQGDEGGWRFSKERPSGGFVSAPTEIPELKDRAPAFPI